MPRLAVCCSGSWIPGKGVLFFEAKDSQTVENDYSFGVKGLSHLLLVPSSDVT
jgi:hypothetical protein